MAETVVVVGADDGATQIANAIKASEVTGGPS